MVEKSNSIVMSEIMEGDPNEFIFGMPRHKYFKVSRKRALVTIVSDYSALREIEGKENYEDLPETIEDLKNILKGLRHLGFEDDDITILKEPTWNDLHLKVIELATDLHKTSMDGEQTLVFTYYAGHGMSDNNLQLQLNEERLYPIERMLRSLAKGDGSYVVALFDCCRERIIAEKQRGVIADEDDAIATAGMVLPESHENFIITYGCPPTEGVPAKSTIAKAYVKYLKKSANPEGLV